MPYCNYVSAYSYTHAEHFGVTLRTLEGPWEAFRGPKKVFGASGGLFGPRETGIEHSATLFLGTLLGALRRPRELPNGTILGHFLRTFGLKTFNLSLIFNNN